MSWLADLAGRAENLLNNLDEQTGAALRNHNIVKNQKDGPETLWERKRRPIPRGLMKKVAPIPDNRSVSSAGRRSPPFRQPSPTNTNETPHSHVTVREQVDALRNASNALKKPTVKKAPPKHNLNYPPKTLVASRTNKMPDPNSGRRRNSLPTELESRDSEEWEMKAQALELENAMLRDELTVMNKGMDNAMQRVTFAEEGNLVDSGEAVKARTELESMEIMNQKMDTEKDAMMLQVEKLKKKVEEITSIELKAYKDKASSLQVELEILRNRNLDLELKCKENQEKSDEQRIAQIKLENDLRHAQSTIIDLQSNLKKSSDECRRLEREWEAYKLRVKNMLTAKDSEIKSLQESIRHSDDSKVLLEQISNLKDERDELSDAIAAVRSECGDMKSYLEQVEERHAAAERVVAALRDALRDERAARNRADAQCLSANKELKLFQLETAQTIACLRASLQEKESEYNQLRESSTRVANCDSSALNVADYETRESIDSNKIQHLTQTLVQRQTKMDSLIAENNTLRIQLEKLQTKYKNEITNARVNYSHSVVHLQDNDSRSRPRVHPSGSLSALSLRIGVMMKRYPFIRLFFITYMLPYITATTVLFTSTPDNFKRPIK